MKFTTLLVLFLLFFFGCKKEFIDDKQISTSLNRDVKTKIIPLPSTEDVIQFNVGNDLFTVNKKAENSEYELDPIKEIFVKNYSFDIYKFEKESGEWQEFSSFKWQEEEIKSVQGFDERFAVLNSGLLSTFQLKENECEELETLEKQNINGNEKIYVNMTRFKDNFFVFVSGEYCLHGNIKNISMINQLYYQKDSEAIDLMGYFAEVVEMNNHYYITTEKGIFKNDDLSLSTSWELVKTKNQNNYFIGAFQYNNSLIIAESPLQDYGHTSSAISFIEYSVNENDFKELSIEIDLSETENLFPSFCKFIYQDDFLFMLPYSNYYNQPMQPYACPNFGSSSMKEIGNEAIIETGHSNPLHIDGKIYIHNGDMHYITEIATQ